VRNEAGAVFVLVSKGDRDDQAPAETLADRCIVIEMHRKTADEKCERIKSLDGTELRQKCARFVMDHGEEIAGAQPEIPGDLNDRAADIWEPLLALSELAGGEWPERARTAAVGLTGSGQEESPIGALLFDILMCFLKGGAERIFSRTLVEILNGMGDRPWAEMRKGKEVTELWLARQLRPYGVRPKTMWICSAIHHEL
jgi:putative DNA primase/helicase